MQRSAKLKLVELEAHEAPKLWVIITIVNDNPAAILYTFIKETKK
jgi:hypothetical protein